MIDMTDKRVEFTVLGRIIGTGTGWDEMDNCHLIIYDFQPGERFPHIPEGDLGVNFNAGTFEYHDDQGNMIASYDIVKELSNPAK